MKLIIPFLLGATILLKSCTAPDSITHTIECKQEKEEWMKDSPYEDIIQKYVQNGLPGIALLIKDEGTVWYSAAGYADISKNIKMEPCHIAKVASLTKIFMGALAFKLAEENVIDLDKPIKEYLNPEEIKDIANADLVTSRQLLNHTTGIYDVIEDNGFYLNVLNNPPAHRDMKEILKYVKGKDALFPPGTQSSYSNTNTLLLAMVIDKAANRPHHELLREKILNKLSLDHSYYFYHEPLPNGEVAQGYYDLFNNNTIVNVSNYNTGSGNGYTGLYTNLFDLLKFSEALFENKTLVSESSLNDMLTFNKELEENSDRYLGQGTMKDFINRSNADEYAYGHRGRDLGYSADLFYFPIKNKTMILIVNYGTDGESKLRPTFFELRKSIVDEMMKE